MNCTTALAGLLWSLDAWLLCSIIAAVAAPFIVWGAAAWWYSSRIKLLAGELQADRALLASGFRTDPE